MRLFLTGLIFITFNTIHAQSNRILLDEDFSDWQDIPVLAADPLGDQGNSAIDFGNLWASNDGDFLFFRLEVGEEINLQEGTEIIMFVDTDNDASSGLPVDGIGVDLVYNFGNLTGRAYANNMNIDIGHADIWLVSSPTVSADEFEIAISRNLQFFGQELFSGNEIKVLFKNNVSGADRIPDSPGGISYTFNNDTPDSLPSYSLEQPPSWQTRVLSYNVRRDALFEADKQAYFSRILKAIEPALIGFQEIYDHSAAQTASKVASFLPLSSGVWHHAKVEPDIIAISRYPILSTHTILPGGNGAFLIDVNSLKLLFIVAHPPCCDNNSGRQIEIDAIMSFIRNAKNGTSPVSLPENSPIIIVGDMNLVGFQQQQKSLLTGDIVNQSTYGPDFNPDWDETPLEDAKPLTTNLPLSMTWYNENSSFSPGRLDYIIYSGSVINLENSFTLFTPALSQSGLAAYGLEANDVVEASDHLPLVADFDLGGTTLNTEIPQDAEISLNVYPNPIADYSTVNYYLPQSSMVELSIYNSEARKVLSLQKESLATGHYSFDLSKVQLSAGIYYCQLLTNFGLAIEKFAVVK